MNNPAFPSEDGNFKRGAFKPIAILVGVLLVGGAGVFAFLSVHSEAQTLTKDEVNKEVREIQRLPRAEQTPRWRKWAAVDNESRLEQEAFVHLAWVKDKASIPSMIRALASPDHAVRGTAAMALVDFGSPDADAAKPVLLKALPEADASDKPQICWALIALKESSAFDAVLAEYKLGHLATVQRLDGFLVCQSLAGGTGSGVGAFLSEALADEFPKARRINAAVWPFTQGEVIVQNYNTMLTLAHLYEVR